LAFCGLDFGVHYTLRRPYKKGAREAGGSSRSDEINVGQVSGMAELFIKIMHEMESSITHNLKVSPSELIFWNGFPRDFGREISLADFFRNNTFAKFEHYECVIEDKGLYLSGRWKRSKTVKLSRNIKISPLWCYTSGLYLAEGTTKKDKFFKLYTSKVSGLGLGFTSSENTSLDLIISALKQLFIEEKEIVRTWKLKVGSQYFPELVTIGLKNNVPMLRGGASGDGKLRTMEISLELKNWALEVGASLVPYADRFSHVEPTGAGVPRIDFAGSSSLCKWYFPLVVFTAFNSMVSNPKQEFIYE